MILYFLRPRRHHRQHLPRGQDSSPLTGQNVAMNARRSGGWLHILNLRIVHHIPQIPFPRHHLLRHLPHTRIIHDTVERTALSHLIGHVHEHGVIHETLQVGHASSSSSSSRTAAKHTCQGREVGEATGSRGGRCIRRGIPRRITRRLLVLFTIFLGCRLESPIHDLRNINTLPREAGGMKYVRLSTFTVETLLISLHTPLCVSKGITSMAQPTPRLGIRRVDFDGLQSVRGSEVVLSRLGVRSSPIRQVNLVVGDKTKCLCVTINGSNIIFLCNGTVAKALEAFCLCSLRLIRRS
jgi:hypothetical protein